MRLVFFDAMMVVVADVRSLGVFMSCDLLLSLLSLFFFFFLIFFLGDSISRTQHGVVLLLWQALEMASAHIASLPISLSVSENSLQERRGER